MYSSLVELVRPFWTYSILFYSILFYILQVELRQLYSSLVELVRPFWTCFPPTTPELQERVRKMYETLQKFQAMKVSAAVASRPNFRPHCSNVSINSKAQNFAVLMFGEKLTEFENFW